MNSGPTLEQIKQAAQARVLDVVAALGIKEAPRGGYIHICNPLEPDRHPSFTIWTSRAVGAWKDHRGIAQGDIIDLVAYLKGWSDGPKKGRREALRWLADLLGLQRLSDEQRRADALRSRALAQREQKLAAEDLAGKQARARSLFIHAPAKQAGGLADCYLQGRGIDLKTLPRGPRGGLRWPRVLRQLYASRHAESRSDLPCMLAACTDAGTRAILAVHRTFLKVVRGEVSKADVTPNRKVWPDFRGLIVPLWRGDSMLSIEEACTAGLRETFQLAEGIETALSMALAAPAYRTWAFISLGNLQNVTLPECCDGVILSRENEWTNAAALRAFERGKAALQRQGRPVIEAFAPAGKDFNDTLRGAA